MPDRFCLPSVSFAPRYGLAKVPCLWLVNLWIADAWREVGRERPLPFAPIGSERYGGKCIFAVIEFAKPVAAGLFFLVDRLLFFV